MLGRLREKLCQRDQAIVVGVQFCEKGRNTPGAHIRERGREFLRRDAWRVVGVDLSELCGALGDALLFALRLNLLFGCGSLRAVQHAIVVLIPLGDELGALGLDGRFERGQFSGVELAIAVKVESDKVGRQTAAVARTAGSRAAMTRASAICLRSGQGKGAERQR